MWPCSSDSPGSSAGLFDPLAVIFAASCGTSTFDKACSYLYSFLAQRRRRPSNVAMIAPLDSDPNAAPRGGG
jgi:hypothetical protein